MLFSEAVAGFLLDARARQLAPGTLADYSNALRKLQKHLGAVELDAVTVATLRQFLASLAEPQASNGIIPRPPRPLSKKQILNIHIGLSAFYTWAQRAGLVTDHPMRQIRRPKPERRVIVPFTQDDITRLLSAIAKSGLVKRNRAIVLVLLDCGLRASELCAFQMRHYDAKQRRLLVFGKGDKERLLPISATTQKALNSYVSAVRKGAAPDAPLFVSRFGKALTRSGLLQLLYGIGKRAGVADCHPHRFRHTFAICYLRNGGDVYSLQMSLGHESLEMCRRYLALAASDLAEVHQRASPVAAWRL